MSSAENEQEFVLGNKQLLSAFFVVVALLGVFFVMGYIIGRNTGAADSSAKKGTSTEPAPITSASNVTDSMPPPVATAPDVTTPAQPERAKPAPLEMPVERKIEKPLERPVEKAEKATVEKPAAAAAETKPEQVESSSGHTYLQVTALKRPAADNIVKVLKERDFRALLGESPKPGYFRVLVGPYSDPEQLSKAKSDIKKMGFEPQVMR